MSNKNYPGNESFTIALTDLYTIPISMNISEVINGNSTSAFNYLDDFRLGEVVIG